MPLSLTTPCYILLPASIDINTKTESTAVKIMKIIKITTKQLVLLVISASLSFADTWMGNLRLYDPDVWPEGRAGNYGTVKYFLDEDLKLPSVATWWCGQANERTFVLDNLDKLVIKPIHRTRCGTFPLRIPVYLPRKGLRT